MAVNMSACVCWRWLLLVTLRVSDEDPPVLSAIPRYGDPGVPFPPLELSEVDAVILNIDSTQPTAKSLTHGVHIPGDIQRPGENTQELGSLDSD